MITLENLDAICTFHKWNDNQIESGTAIRSTAKELMRSMIQQREESNVFARIDDFDRAITNSSAHTPGAVQLTNLGLYSLNRRKKAHEQVDVLRSMYRVRYHLPEMLSFINEIVMMANSAITFEAAASEALSLPEPDREEQAEKVEA
jgi:hypothetical protein